jgi:hypothetical protein
MYSVIYPHRRYPTVFSYPNGGPRRFVPVELAMAHHKPRPWSDQAESDQGLGFWLEHDLSGKPEVYPRIKSEGMLFQIML